MAADDNEQDLFAIGVQKFLSMINSEKNTLDECLEKIRSKKNLKKSLREEISKWSGEVTKWKQDLRNCCSETCKMARELQSNAEIHLDNINMNSNNDNRKHLKIYAGEAGGRIEKIKKMWDKLEQDAEKLKSKWKDVIVIEVKKQIPISWGNQMLILLKYCLSGALPGAAEGAVEGLKGGIVGGLAGAIRGAILGAIKGLLSGGVDGLDKGRQRIDLDSKDANNELKDVEKESEKVEGGFMFNFEVPSENLAILESDWDKIKNRVMKLSQEELISRLTNIIESCKMLDKFFEDIWMKKVQAQMRQT